MDRVTKDRNGIYRWTCSVDKEFHRGSGRKILWGILIICAVVLIVFFFASRGTGAEKDFWIPALVTGVVLVIAVPLLLLWNSAEDPHEQYEMTEEYVKSGYGKAAVFSEFKKTEEVTVTEKYIELTGKNRTNRVYVPAEDRNLVRDHILSRIPAETVVKRG